MSAFPPSPLSNTLADRITENRVDHLASPSISRLASSQPFWSPEKELLEKCQEKWQRRSSVGVDLDRFISNQHAQRQKTNSWHHDPTLSFQEWRQGFLNRLQDSLIVPGARNSAVDPVLKSRIDRGDFIEEHVEITLTPPFRAKALVTIPKNGASQHPALVLLHSLGSLTLYGKEKLLHRPGEPSYLSEYRRQLYAGRSLLADFARSGYLCIAIDAFGFGERTQWASRNSETFDKERSRLTLDEAEELSFKIIREESERNARALGSVGLSLAALTATDDVRTVDYLNTRADVDSSRIGCTGLSFGSFRANYLAALDDRVHAAASVCWISSLDGIVDYNIPLSLGFFAIPGELYRHFDMIDIPTAAAPKPFLAISGWKDVLMEPRGTAAAHLSLRRAWEAAGHPENLGSLIFDAEHEFNLEMQQTTLDFFKRFLSRKEAPKL